MEVETDPDPKKILYLITKSNFGGAQRYVFELATAMQEKGHDVTVAFGGDGLLQDKLEDYLVKTRTIKSFQRDISFFKEFKSLAEIYELYKEIKPDIVHLNSSKAGGSGALVARLVGIKNIIYTAHGWAFWEPRSRLWRLLVYIASWLTALLATKIILVSEFEAKRVSFPLIKKSKYFVIHTAVPDISFLDKLAARRSLLSESDIGIHQQDYWLVSTVELNHNKNIFAAIDAVAKYNQTHQKKIFYCVMGDGDLQEELAQYISKQNALNHIKLLGYVDNGRTYLKAFDFFLLPSLKEGLPYAILEAGAARLPVVASRVGGIPEVIDDNLTGLLINPKNTENIVSALIKLTSDANLAADLATSLNRRVQEDFSLAKMVSKTAVLYK